MALTAAEKQKRYRERQRLKSPTSPTPPTLSANLPEQGFRAFIQASAERMDSYDWFREALIAANLKLEFNQEPRIPDYIQKVESAISDLTDALVYITGMAAEYRIHQIDAEIEALQQNELPLRKAESEVASRIRELTNVRKHLQKKYRIDLYDYFVPRV